MLSHSYAFSSVGEVHDVNVQLKWHHQFQFAGFYAAKELGYYRDANLNVTINARDQVLSGNAQFGVADTTLVMHRLKGLPVVALLASYKYSPLILVTRKSDNIINPIQLKNKRIMYQRNSDDSAILALFDKFNIKATDITHVDMLNPVQALENNQIDAYSGYITNQPFLHSEQGFKTNIINPANYGIDFIGDLTYTSEAYLATNYQQVIDFRRATIKGWQYALKNPEQVIDWIIHIYHSNKDKAQLLQEATASLSLFDPDLTKFGEIDPERLNHAVQLYKKLNKASKNSKLDGFNINSRLADKLAYWQVILLVLIVVLAVITMMFFIRKQVAVLAHQVYGLFSKSVLVEATHQYLIEQNILSYRTDKDDCFVFVSPAFCSKLGYSREELIGKARRMLYHPKFTSVNLVKITKSLEQWLPWSGEVMYQSKEGDCYWHRSQFDPIVKNDYLLGYSAIEYDISEKKHLEQSSIIDAITGLFNRFRIEQLIHYERIRSIRTHYPFSILILELNGLGILVEKEGQQVLDDFLLAMANIVNNEIRISDTAGRWSHDQILVVCPETSLEGVDILANKILKTIGKYKFDSCFFVKPKLLTGELQSKEEVAQLLKRIISQMA